MTTMPDDSADVVVTCTRHAETPQFFPQVLGHYLAKHLERAGVRAIFRHLPLPGVECEVLICSEYQAPFEWFEQHLAGPLGEIQAARMFCLVDYSLGGEEHWSSDYCKWFADRGGVLCLLAENEFAPYEHWIGVGVDTEVVGSGSGDRRNVIFDFPHGASRDVSRHLDTSDLAAVRDRLQGVRFVGTGPAETPQRSAFDEWVEHGQPHDVYVSRLLRDALAFVPGTEEAMGLTFAEAQVAGACIVHRPGEAKDWILCPEAAVTYELDDPAALAGAIVEAIDRDEAVIRKQATERFDYARVVARTRGAICV